MKKSGKDPIFEQELICPICNSAVTSYQLRAKSQKIVDDIFMVSHYEGLSGYFAENFNKIQTTVCPSCFFASPDPKDFTKESKFTGDITKSALEVNGQLIARLRAAKTARNDIVVGVATEEKDFLRPRSPQAAITSLKLSITRAMEELKADFPNTYYKIGAYNIKIANIEKEIGINYIGSLKEAIKYLELAITKSDCSKPEIEAQVLYIFIATNLKIRDIDKAAPFMKFFKDSLAEIEKELKEKPLKKKSLTKTLRNIENWQKKAQTLWEDRDDDKFWEEQ